MLSKLLAGAGAEAISYSDITVVTSGTLIGNAAITFSPALQQDDVVFLIIGDNDTDYTIPSGYIEITGAVITGVYRFSCYYKVMGFDPDNGINLNDGNDSSGGTYYALRGVQTESPVIEVNYTVGTSRSANLTPPALPAPAKSVFLTAAFTGDGSSAVLTAAPSGYTGFLTRDVSGSGDTFVGSAYKTITATGTETPGAFTLSNTAAEYAAVSIVVRPYSAGFTDVAPALISTSNAQTTSNATNLSMSRPVGTINGDLMVALLTTGGGSASGWTAPAGWDEVADSTTGRPVNAAYWKTASGEGESYTFSMSGPGRTLAGAILTYRYAAYDAIGAFSAQATSPTIPSVVSAFAQSILISIVGYDATSGPTIRGMTSRVLDAGGTAPSFRVYDSPLAKGPSGTRNTTTGGSNSNGVQLVLKPTSASRPLQDITFITSATNASSDDTSTLVVPPGVQAGDLLVWSDYVPNYASGTIPSGFTEIVLTTANVVNHRTAYKIATGTESGTTLTGMTGSDFANALAVFRGAIPFTGAAFTTWNSEGLTDGNPAQQTVSVPALGASIILAAAGARGTAGNITFSSQSPTFAGTVSSRNSGGDALTLGYNLYGQTPVAQTVDVADVGTRNTLQSGLLSVF